MWTYICFVNEEPGDLSELGKYTQVDKGLLHQSSHLYGTLVYEYIQVS